MLLWSEDLSQQWMRLLKLRDAILDFVAEFSIDLSGAFRSPLTSSTTFTPVSSSSTGHPKPSCRTSSPVPSPPRVVPGPASVRECAICVCRCFKEAHLLGTEECMSCRQCSFFEPMT